MSITTRPTSAMVRWVFALLVVLFAAGCQKLAATHEQNVSAANSRWRNARSSMMLSMAQRQFEAGDLDEADKTLREAASIDPTNGRLHLLGGRVALERGRLEQAAKLFQAAIEFTPELPDAHYYYGLVLQRWQRYEAALEHYNKAFELQDDNPAFLIACSEMLVALDRWDDAIALLKSKLVIFDQNAGLRVAIGQIYLIQEKYEEAAQYLREGSILRPDDLQIIEKVVMAEIGAGQLERATRELERLLEHPDFAKRHDLHRALAECYRRQARLEDAKQVYVRLTRSDPTDSETWVKLAEIAMAMQDWNGAHLASNRIMALAPKRYEGYLMAGLVAQQRDQLDHAITLFDRAAQLAPDNAMPVILRGLALERAGRTGEAAQAYADALARQPDDERARQLLARVERAD